MRQRLSMSLRGSTNENGCEFAEEARVAEPLRLQPQQLVRHALASEFARVCRSPIDGMYVVPSALNPFEWFGILFIRRGVFGGGIFRFNLSIPEDFPNTRTMPVVTFDMPIFHPNIHMKTNELDMQRYFPDGWKKDKHHMQNVLLVVQRVFFSLDVDCDSCANAEAAILWKEHKDKFREMTKDRVNQSRAQVYDDPKENDPNAIRLTPWDASVHESVRERMMLVGGGRQCDMSSFSGNTGGSKQRGFSWVDTERMTYMTEPVSARMHYEPDMRAEQDRVAFGIERLDLSGVSSDESPVHTGQQSPPPSQQTDSAIGSCSAGHSVLERKSGVMMGEGGGGEETGDEQGTMMDLKTDTNQDSLMTLHTEEGESDI